MGDCLLMVGGNGDAIMRVTSVSGGGVTAVSVVYGGTGYTTGLQLVGMPVPPGSRFGVVTGTLTSNARSSSRPVHYCKVAARDFHQ